MEEGEEFKNLKVVRSIKMLGYMIDSRSNNWSQVNYIKKKIQKAEKMLWIAGANGTNCWRRLYIYLQYISPHMRYGAN